MLSLIKKIFSFKKNNTSTDTLYVSNLTYSATSYDLSNAFSVFGEIQNARIIKDQATRKSKGYGFITFSKAKDAKKALAKVDSMVIKGRTVRIKTANKRENIY